MPISTIRTNWTTVGAKIVQDYCYLQSWNSRSIPSDIIQYTTILGFVANLDLDCID